MAVIIDSTAVINAVRLKEQAGDPAAPAATYWLLYAKAAGLFIEDSAAAVTGPFGTGGGGAWGTATLLNDSGGSVAQGDLVFIADYGTASAFTTVSGDPLATTMFPGIVEDASIASAATGLVRLFGVAPVSNLDASATQGDRIAASTTAKQATPHTMSPGGLEMAFDSGDFGIALAAGTTPPVLLWGLPIQRGERMLAWVTGRNLNTGTDQILYHVPAGRSCVITKIVLRNASTSLTTWSGSFGWNSTAFNNVIADATHTELTGNTLYTALLPKIGATVGVAADTLKLKNNTLQGGAATVDVEVHGYLF